MEKNYAVMRHAHTNDINNIIEKLNKFFVENRITEFQIWHSPRKRACLTGEILKEFIQIPCVNFLEKDFLDCGNDQIQDNLPNEQVFVLMISHQPDINHYLRKIYSIDPEVYNCDIFVAGVGL